MTTVVTPKVVNVVATVKAPSASVKATVQTKTVKVTAKVRGGVPMAPPPAATSSFIHTQSTPAASWVITNPWGAEVADVTVKDELGRFIYTGVDASGTQFVTVTFPLPRAGKAFLRRA